MRHHFTPMNYSFPSWESCLFMVPTPGFHSIPSQRCVCARVCLPPEADFKISLPICKARSMQSIQADSCCHPADHQNLGAEMPSGCSKVVRLDSTSQPSSVASVKLWPLLPLSGLIPRMSSEDSVMSLMTSDKTHYPTDSCIQRKAVNWLN